MKPPLSKQKRFSDALIIAAEWSNMMGHGVSETAFLWRDRHTEIWLWDSEYGSTCAAKLNGTATIAELVTECCTNEQLSSQALVRSTIRITRDRPPLGAILAAALAAEDDAAQFVRLLTRLSWPSIQKLHKNGIDVIGGEMRACLARIGDCLAEHDLDVEDLAPPGDPSQPTIAEVDKCLREAISATLRRDPRMA